MPQSVAPGPRLRAGNDRQRNFHKVSLLRMYVLQTEMTKLREEVIERVRQLPEAVQEVSCARVLPADNCIFARKGD
jgi:hypothetical protein